MIESYEHVNPHLLVQRMYVSWSDFLLHVLSCNYHINYNHAYNYRCLFYLDCKYFFGGGALKWSTAFNIFQWKWYSKFQHDCHKTIFLFKMFHNEHKTHPPPKKNSCYPFSVLDILVHIPKQNAFATKKQNYEVTNLSFKSFCRYFFLAK